MELPVVVIIYTDEAVRASVRFLFELQGWTVRDFSSPAEFVASLNPACLVLGQDLPGMTGLQLAEEVRKRGLDVPVVLTANAGDAGAIARADEAGAVAVDSLMPEDLIEAVNYAISRPPSSTTSASSARCDT